MGSTSHVSNAMTRSPSHESGATILFIQCLYTNSIIIDKKYNYYQLSLSLIMRNGLGLRTRLLTTRRTILRQYSITHLWTERKCVVHWYAHDHHLVDTVLHVVVMMGQQDPTLPPHTRGPPLHQKIAPFHTIASALVPHPLLLRGPTSSIAGWRCSECKHCCGSSHCDHTNHRNSAAHS